jgi:hypothetical protein
MPVQFQWERVNDPDERVEIEKAILDGLGSSGEEWRVTVVRFVSTPSYVVDVSGPGIRWGEFYSAQPNMLQQIKKDIEKLATFCSTHSVSGQSFQARPNSAERAQWMARPEV